jgi:hypothetical protein
MGRNCAWLKVRSPSIKPGTLTNVAPRVTLADRLKNARRSIFDILLSKKSQWV